VLLTIEQNRGVPKYVEPELPTPEWAKDVIDFLGVNPLRVAILRTLASGQAMTSGEIGREIGVRYKTVAVHLSELERLGGIVTDAEEGAGQRRGQHVRYRLADGAVEGALADLERHIRDS
jgi:DNA-binding transcriptional ArsR family regulator